jgi:5'(3')-deoxyribonucleotidase
MSKKTIIAVDLDRVLGPHSSALFPSIRPYAGSIEAIAKLKKKYELHVITARHPFFKQRSIDWVNKFFPGIFNGIDFVYYKTPFGPRSLKSQICKRIGAKIILDDKMSNAVDCAKHGVRVYLFGIQNMHRRNHLPKNITWVKDWSVVLEELL